MSVRQQVTEEVYDGLRCAVCELAFNLRTGEIGVAVSGTGERVHPDAPDGCPATPDSAAAREAGPAAGGAS